MKQPEIIILAFAHIKDHQLSHQNFELQTVREAFKDAEENKKIEVIGLNGITYEYLSDYLVRGKGRNATMLHFSGHSSGEGLFVQYLDEGGIIKKEPLSNLVRIHKKFRFVFLNSCYSEKIALELVNAGVPYVIGTTDRINDSQAAVVAAKFYSYLAKYGRTVEDSFILARAFFEDELCKSDRDINIIFRSFILGEERQSEYPWQLYKSGNLTNKQKRWVLINKRSLNQLYVLLISLIIIGVYTVVMFPDKLKSVFTKTHRDPTPEMVTKPRDGPNNRDTIYEDPARITDIVIPVEPLRRTITKSIIIEGSVTDNKTGELLDSVKVSIKNAHTYTRDGWFRIELPQTLKPGEVRNLSIDYVFAKDDYLVTSYQETISIDSNFSSHTTSANLNKKIN